MLNQSLLKAICVALLSKKITLMKKANIDLQRFIDKFQPNKFKLIPSGIEIRGAVDLHGAMNEARLLIERLQLSLYVSHNAEMLTYKGFEVNLLAEAS